MKNKNKVKASGNCSRSKIKVTKVSEDYCIMNGNKIEGNACNTILNDK
jgi:hypothetical protein